MRFSLPCVWVGCDRLRSPGFAVNMPSFRITSFPTQGATGSIVRGVLSLLQDSCILCSWDDDRGLTDSPRLRVTPSRTCELELSYGGRWKRLKLWENLAFDTERLKGGSAPVSLSALWGSCLTIGRHRCE